MRHFHGHLHGKNRGCESLSGRDGRDTFTGAYSYMPREGLSLGVGISVHPNRESLTGETDGCALDRSAFYKRRPTPKPGLDFCPRDSAEISAGISNKFPLGFRWRAVGQPMERRWSTTVRVPPCHCTARGVPSTYCSRAALHVAARGLRQWQARRASRWGNLLPIGDAGNCRKHVQHKIRNFAQPKLNAKNHGQRGQLSVSENAGISVSRVLLWLP